MNQCASCNETSTSTFNVKNHITGDPAEYCRDCALKKIYKVLWSESPTNEFTRSALFALKQIIGE